MNRVLYLIRWISKKYVYGRRLTYYGQKNGIPTFMRNSSIKIGPHGTVFLGNIRLNENAFVCCADGQIEIEDGVTINRNSVVVGRHKIHIGRGTSIGPNVCIYDHDHKFDIDGFKKKEFFIGDVFIGKECWLGAGVIVLKGTHIGDHCVIGAATVVKGNIAPNSMVTGNRELKIRPLENRD